MVRHDLFAFGEYLFVTHHNRHRAALPAHLTPHFTAHRYHCWRNYTFALTRSHTAALQLYLHVNLYQAPHNARDAAFCALHTAPHSILFYASPYRDTRAPPHCLLENLALQCFAACALGALSGCAGAKPFRNRLQASAATENARYGGDNHHPASISRQQYCLAQHHTRASRLLFTAWREYSYPGAVPASRVKRRTRLRFYRLPRPRAACTLRLLPLGRGCSVVIRQAHEK